MNQNDMSTLEAIQYLLDNPEESVEETSATLTCILKNENGCIMMYNKAGERYGVLTLTEEKLKSCWQVVKKPPRKVGFMEAVNSIKRIRPTEKEGNIYKFNHPSYWYGVSTLTLDEINGLWEIEE